ncbi:MAG: hypothetical protein ACYC0Y_16110, partial [Pirellulales bacterium]
GVLLGIRLKATHFCPKVRRLFQLPRTQHSVISLIDLGDLGGNRSEALGINDLGQVVGYGNTVGGRDRAFLWQESTGMSNLGTLGGYYSYAYDINNLGQVVGDSSIGSGNAYHAFLWQDGVMIDLNSWLPSNSGLELIAARGVNDKGQVVGYGRTSSGQIHAFLLSPEAVPVPEPSSLAIWYLLSATLLGISLWSQKRSR